MLKIGIKLKTLIDIKTFVRKAALFDYKVDIDYDGRIIDAKSLLDVVSLDTTRVLTVLCHTHDTSILTAISKYTLNTTLEVVA